jgi:hypothetical protein
MSAVEATRSTIGGMYLYTIAEKTGFVVNVILLQYLNVDAIIYYLNNSAYLESRYTHKRFIFFEILLRVVVTNLVFVILLIVAGIGVFLVQAQIPHLANVLELIELSLRGFLLFGTFVLVQFILLMKTSQTNTFAFLTVISIAICIFSPVINPSFSMFPFILSGTDLAINLFVSSSVFIIGVIIAYRIFIKKEYRYEY